MLHNFLKKTDTFEDMSCRYCKPGYADALDTNGDVIDGSWRQESESKNVLKSFTEKNAGKSSKSAIQIQETLNDFYNSPDGEVAWQYASVRRGL